MKVESKARTEKHNTKDYIQAFIKASAFVKVGHPQA